MVHKGLDLVLEAFADMPGYEVVICGPVDGETDVVAAYRSQLCQSSNVRTLNWVDVTRPSFIELMNSCMSCRVERGAPGSMRERTAHGKDLQRSIERPARAFCPSGDNDDLARYLGTPQSALSLKVVVSFLLAGGKL